MLRVSPAQVVHHRPHGCYRGNSCIFSKKKCFTTAAQRRRGRHVFSTPRPGGMRPPFPALPANVAVDGLLTPLRCRSTQAERGPELLEFLPAVPLTVLVSPAVVDLNRHRQQQRQQRQQQQRCRHDDFAAATEGLRGTSPTPSQQNALCPKREHVSSSPPLPGFGSGIPTECHGVRSESVFHRILRQPGSGSGCTFKLNVIFTRAKCRRSLAHPATTRCYTAERVWSARRVLRRRRRQTTNCRKKRNDVLNRSVHSRIAGITFCCPGLWWKAWCTWCRS